MSPDVLTPEQRRKNMSAIKSKNTKIELQLRSLLHAAGFRYRLHKKSLPGCPDIFLKKYNAAIFVNSCFWHCHEDCHYFRGIPATNSEFWRIKLLRNLERDKNNYRLLRARGIRVCIVWQCALKGRYRMKPDKISEEISYWLNSDIEFTSLSGAGQTRRTKTK